MDGDAYDANILGVLSRSEARVLLIGRRALIVLGVPVMTADYDLWLHFDDLEILNHDFAAIDHWPNRPPDEARRRGRYVLENGEHVDVMVARGQSTPDGVHLDFDAAWSRRQSLVVDAATEVFLPSLDDLILTKRWGGRAKDVADIALLERLRRTS